MDDKYARQIRNILAVALAILLLAVFKITSSISITLILSIFIFFFVMPLTNAMENHKFPSWLASVISILVIVVTIVVACRFLVNVVDVMIKTLPGYSSRVQQIDGLVTAFISRWFELPEDFSVIKSLDIDWLSLIMPALKTVSSQTMTIASDALVTLLFTVFLLLERHTIIPKAIMISSKSTDPDKIVDIMNNMNHQVSSYLVLKLCISAITGICFYLIALLTHLDFALIWGVLAFFLNFIPSFGSIIVTALTIAMSLIQFLPNWTPIIIVSVGTILTQNVLGNVIEPAIQGNQLNLSAFVILVAASIFGYVWGIIGMFLAVPLLSVIVIIFSNIESTKGIAIVLSSGKSIRKHVKSDRKNKKPNPLDDFYI